MSAEAYRQEQHLRSWLEWGRRRRRWATSTCDDYRRRLRHYLAWCQAECVRPRRATPADVRRHLETLHVSPAVWTSAHTALLAYHDWLVETGEQDRNPVRLVDRAKARRSIPRSLSVGEAADVLASAKEHGPKWWVFIALMLYAGLRRAEACKVRWADFESDLAWLRVDGKGGFERVVPVHERLRAILGIYQRSTRSADWLFPGRYPGTCMSVASATQWTRRILDEAGAPGATGHWCRHTFASLMVEGGVDVPTVQAALGHRALSSTSIYVMARSRKVAEAVATLAFDTPGAVAVEAQVATRSGQ